MDQSSRVTVPRMWHWWRRAAAFIALSILLVGSLWVVPYLPTNDGPEWVFASHLENHYSDPGTIYGDELLPTVQFASRGFGLIYGALESVGWLAARAPGRAEHRRPAHRVRLRCPGARPPRRTVGSRVSRLPARALVEPLHGVLAICRFERSRSLCPDPDAASPVTDLARARPHLAVAVHHGGRPRLRGGSHWRGRSRSVRCASRARQAARGARLRRAHGPPGLAHSPRVSCCLAIHQPWAAPGHLRAVRMAGRGADDPTDVSARAPASGACRHASGSPSPP